MQNILDYARPTENMFEQLPPELTQSPSDKHVPENSETLPSRKYRRFCSRRSGNGQRMASDWARERHQGKERALAVPRFGNCRALD